VRNSKKYRAQIFHKGKTQHLGCFKSADFAHKVYCKAKARLFREAAAVIKTDHIAIALIEHAKRYESHAQWKDLRKKGGKEDNE